MSLSVGTRRWKERGVDLMLQVHNLGTLPVGNSKWSIAGKKIISFAKPHCYGYKGQTDYRPVNIRLWT